MRTKIPTVQRMLLASALFIMMSCADEPVAPSSEGMRTSSPSRTLSSGEGAFEEGERDLAEIVAEVPSFGGFFANEDGSISVWVRDEEHHEAAKRAIRARVANQRIFTSFGSGPVRIVVLKGAYSVHELAAWRAKLLTARREVPWRMLDLDEGRNRVSVGLASNTIDRDRAALLAFASVHGIPHEALLTVRTELPAESRTIAERSVTVPNLGIYADTLVGGLRYHYWNQDTSVYSACTIGFPVTFSAGGSGFISAGHCSSFKWLTDGIGSVVGQPGLGSGAIGFELLDPGGGNCPLLWFWCDRYRYSDANLYSVTGRPVRLAHLARPSTRNSIWSIGDTTLASAATIPIVGQSSSIVQGSTMDKIGATGGWIYGTIHSTCAAYVTTGSLLVRCADAIGAQNQGGDSGGPVFYYNAGAGTATATGISFGNATADWMPLTLFSRIGFVQSDLGSAGFSITTGSAPSGSASIFGVSAMLPAATCTWYVSANFGYTSVEWYVDGVLMGSAWDFTHSASASFVLDVFVSDGSAMFASASKSVTVGSGSAECYVQ